MKILIEICQKMTPHTILFIKCSIVFLIAMLTTSAVSGIIADATPYYYELEMLCSDLALALRPCAAILGIGAIGLQWAETTQLKP